MATTLKVTAKERITVRKNVLNHLGPHFGDKLDIDPLKGGRMRLRPKRGNSAATVFGMLARPGTTRLSVEELNRIAASGWAATSLKEPSPSS